jgi:hypothetical protein
MYRPGTPRPARSIRPAVPVYRHCIACGEGSPVCSANCQHDLVSTSESRPSRKERACCRGSTSPGDAGCQVGDAVVSWPTATQDERALSEIGMIAYDSRSIIVAAVRDNRAVRQLQLFTTAELATMRDRTASRNFSPAKDEFRRTHRRHRAWGLGQRHAERLRRSRARSNLDRTAAAGTPGPAPAPSVRATRPAPARSIPTTRPAPARSAPTTRPAPAHAVPTTHLAPSARASAFAKRASSTAPHRAAPRRKPVSNQSFALGTRQADPTPSADLPPPRRSAQPEPGRPAGEPAAANGRSTTNPPNRADARTVTGAGLSKNHHHCRKSDATAISRSGPARRCRSP